MTISDLDTFIAILAFHLAHTTAQPLNQAQYLVRGLIEQARQDYRAAGAPHGDDDAGLLRWLDEHWPTTPLA
jgi:hypothetical protein